MQLQGIHDPGGEHLFQGRPGWVLHNVYVGDDQPHDFSSPAPDIEVIVRLNHGRTPLGTIPARPAYEAFAERCGALVRNSTGCHRWLIGNEPNFRVEWPEGQPILPSDYADCFALCAKSIWSQSGHGEDELIPAAVAPWNTNVSYPVTNPYGDWVFYFRDMLGLILQRGVRPTALAIHTYTHGPDPNLIYDESKMATFPNRYYNFLAYRDMISGIPEELQDLPVYITETDQDGAWDKDTSRQWIKNAAAEIDWWNHQANPVKVHNLIFYRWSASYDNYGIEKVKSACDGIWDISNPGYAVPVKPAQPPETAKVGAYQYMGWFQQFGKEYSIPWNILAGLAYCESRFNPKAVSSAGAQGLMQFMPATRQDVAKTVPFDDPFNAKQSIRAAAFYLAQLLAQLKRGGKEPTWRNAFAAYNWGIGNVLKAEAWEDVPVATRTYARDILIVADAIEQWEGE